MKFGKMRGPRGFTAKGRHAAIVRHMKQPSPGRANMMLQPVADKE